MHSDETKTKFLELRSRNVSYQTISEQLGVSKPTLIQWARELAPIIEDLRAAHREAVKEKLLGNFHDWLQRQVAHFNRLDQEFAKREFKYSPTESVFRMMMASRQALEKLVSEPEPLPQRRETPAVQPSSDSARPEGPETKPAA